MRGDERGAALELDLGVCAEGDVAGIALVDLAVVQGSDVPGGGADPVRAERLAPFVEELAQGEGPADRGLDVDDAVSGMGVQPVRQRPPPMKAPPAIVWDCAPGMPMPAGICRGAPLMKMVRWEWIWKRLCSVV